MKPSLVTSWMASQHFVGMTVAFVLLAGLVSAFANPVVTPGPGTEHQSVFLDKKGFGRDPFFPNSRRREGPVPVAQVVEVVHHNVSLKGISGTREKRLAIINNRTFEAGEEAELRISGQVLKVKCLEIREKSAVVSINGMARELFLGQKL